MLVQQHDILSPTYCKFIFEKAAFRSVTDSRKSSSLVGGRSRCLALQISKGFLSKGQESLKETEGEQKHGNCMELRKDKS